MVCVYCGSKTRVKNSRQQKRNNQVWRRRQCRACKAVFTSNEAIDLSGAFFVGKEPKITPFLADKLYVEVLLALQDRKDSYIAAREITSTVVRKLLKLPGKPVFSPQQISQVTAEVLKRFNRRAWLRYISEHPSLLEK